MFFYSSKFYNYSAEISSAISSSQNLLIIMKSSSYSNFAANTLQNTFNIQSSSTSPFATPLPKPLEKIVRKQMKPCEKFGLDPVKLQNQELLKHRSYRRLYNIVANDQTEANQVFRPNLIKELYFLLQIAPFIQSSLLDGFLSKIQDWYNSNDHKKIKLSKNLDGMIQNVLQEKKQNSKTLDKKSVIRPKTGNQWDTSLVSFLRPYTAKLRNNAISNHKDRQSQERSYRRPQSSKFGASTTDNTNYCKQKSRIHRMSNQIDDFSTQNIDILMQNRDIKEEQSECDLMEEWERSEDFKKKYRTVHPQEQPTYQKLMNLIMDLKTNKNQTSKSSDKKRKIQSATLAKQAANARALAEKQLNVKKDEIQAPNQQIQCGKDIEDSCDDNAQQSIQIQPEQEVVNLQRKSKNYLQDKRSKQGRKLYNPQNKNQMYQMLNGVKILRPFTVKQNHIISKLGQYSCLQQNKRIIETKLDEQCAQKYKEFIRNKNAIKRQITRKSQSKRYMENFRKVVKILPSHSKNKQNIGEYSTNGFNQTGQPRQTLEKVFDFTSIPGVSDQDQNIPIKSTYNVKDYFEPVKKQTVVASYRTIKKSIIQPQNQIQNQGSMTNPKRLLSQQKFDPLHRNNLQNYNREALAEIQRIKQKMNGKISASTDALLKALYIDAPYPLAELETNKKQQKFEIPDKRYLMILKEQKKKKKRKIKHTKLNKSTDKSRR